MRKIFNEAQYVFIVNCTVYCQNKKYNNNKLGFQPASLLASGCRPIAAVQYLLQAAADMCCCLFVRKLVASADLNIS